MRAKEKQITNKKKKKKKKKKEEVDDILQVYPY